MFQYIRRKVKRTAVPIRTRSPSHPFLFVFAGRSFYMAYNETPTDWTAMFKKRIVADISLTKSPKNEEDNETVELVAESFGNIINGVIEDLVRPAAKIIVGSIITVTAVSAICKIAIKTTHTN